MDIEAYRRRTKNNVAEQTLKSRMSALRQMEEFIGEDRELEVEDVERWMDTLIEKHDRGEIKTGTIKQYYKSVKYYFQTVKGEMEALDHMRSWIPDNDTDHGDFLTRGEWDEMLDSAYGMRENAILTLMYNYARRPGEVILLNIEDIDLDEGNIKFPILKKQETFRATFELTDSARDSIKSYLQYRTDQTVEAEQEWEDGEVEPLFTTSHGRISYDTVWSRVKTISERAGIEKNITPKSMRHSRATHLDWAGNSPGEIARQQLVHDPDSDVIGAYIHDQSEDEVREVMDIDE